MAKRLRLFRRICATALMLACIGASPTHADDAAPQELTVATADAPVAIKLFPGRQDGRRPAVIILHGAQGIERFAAAYRRYAETLAQKGIDAVLVSYYAAADIEPMGSSDQASRQAYFYKHLPEWSARIRDVVSFMARRDVFSGKVGLLGFSNGGFLAVTSAASDPRIDALVVFYGGIPGPAQHGLAHLPPLLALHGDADRNVPLSSGKALVDRAAALGGAADLVVYPCMGHGFDFDPSRPEAADALTRTVSFLQAHLW